MLRMMMGVALLGFALLSYIPAYAASGAGRVAYTSGEAWIERGKDRREVRRGESVLRNDYIVTGERGRVKLVMSDGTKVYVGAKSRVGVRKYAMRGKNLFQASFDMAWGKARFFVNKLVARNSSFKVRTSTAVLGVRGTSILAEVNPVNFATNFTLMTGFAQVSPLNAQGEVMGYQMVNMGQTAIIGANHTMVVVQASAKDMSHGKPENWNGSPEAQGGSKASGTKASEPKSDGGKQKKAKQEEPKPTEKKDTPKKLKQPEPAQAVEKPAKVKAEQPKASPAKSQGVLPKTPVVPVPTVVSPVTVPAAVPAPLPAVPAGVSAGEIAQQTAQQLAQETAQQVAQQTAQEVAQQVTQQITQQVTQQVVQDVVNTVIQNTNTSVNIQPSFVLP